MEGNRFNYCPDCGGRNVALRGVRWLCADCGLELYNNVAAAVGVIVRDGRGQVLFETRAKEPRKGFLALPGGFAGPDESLEQAALRECLEETGVALGRIRYVSSFPNDYLYKGIAYKTCDVFFEAEFPPDAELRAEASEVQGFVWKKVESESDVDALPLAFGSAKKALLAWLEGGAR